MTESENMKIRLETPEDYLKVENLNSSNPTVALVQLELSIAPTAVMNRNSIKRRVIFLSMVIIMLMILFK